MLDSWDSGVLLSRPECGLVCSTGAASVELVEGCLPAVGQEPSSRTRTAGNDPGGGAPPLRDGSVRRPLTVCSGSCQLAQNRQPRISCSLKSELSDPATCVRCQLSARSPSAACTLLAESRGKEHRRSAKALSAACSLQTAATATVTLAARAGARLRSLSSKPDDLLIMHVRALCQALAHSLHPLVHVADHATAGCNTSRACC